MEVKCELRLIKQREKLLLGLIEKHQETVDTCKEELYNTRETIKALEGVCKCQEK